METDRDIDIKSIRQLQDQIKQEFEERQREWTDSYKQKLKALQNEYSQESQRLDQLYDKFYKAYEIAVHDENQSSQSVTYE